jgi:hypothetical protein
MKNSSHKARPGSRISPFHLWPLLASPTGSLTILVFLFILSIGAHAQQSTARFGWQRVKALSPGLEIDLKSTTKHLRCKLADVTDETLTCTHGSAVTPQVFQRASIASIKMGRRGRSALIGAGIGGAALGTAGFAVTTNSKDTFFGPNFLRGPVTGLGALGGGIIGAGIGALTNFSKTTIYKAP